jgi:glutamyl-tRNA reductase
MRSQVYLPVLQGLERHIQSILEETMARHRRKFTDEEWPRVEVFARSLLKRLMHLPLKSLREDRIRAVSPPAMAEILSDLFELECRSDAAPQDRD